jgi:hypothetical protein
VLQEPWPAVARAPNLAYRAPNATRFPPTQSRGQEVSVLLTYGGENSPREAGGGGAIRSVFNYSGSGS